MKKIISLVLSLVMIAGLCTAFAASAAETAAPKITVDGKLDDWKDTHTLSVVGTGEFDGKSVTFYGVVTDEGIYLAADAYHDSYKTTAGEWWQNTNFEIFVNRRSNRDNQMWISSRGMSDTNKTPDKSHKEMDAAMVTEAVENGKAAYHTVAEVFIPKTLGFVADNIINGSARVGIAWKTEGDRINNGEANGGGADEYWMPKGTYPDNKDKAVVNADGIFTQAEADYGDYGINATFYSSTDNDALKAALPKGKSGRDNGDTNGSQCIPENFKYAESIEDIMKVMKKERTKVIETIEDAATWGDWYLVELEGYLTPKATGDYTFGAFQVDNCFYMSIDGKTVYEFWANDIYNANDGGGNTYTESIKLEEGKAYKFEAVFLELDGGEVIELNAKIGSADATFAYKLFTFTTEDPTPATKPEPTDPPATTEPEYEYKDIEYTVADVVDSDERAAQSDKIGNGVFWRDQNWEGSEVTFTKAEVSGKTVNLAFTHTGSNSFGAQFFYNPVGTVNGTTYKVVLKVKASVATSITVNGTAYALAKDEEKAIEYLVTADMHPENTEYQYGTSVVAIQFGVKDPFQDIADGEYSITIDSIQVQSQKQPGGNENKPQPKPPTGDVTLAVVTVALVAVLGTAVVVTKRRKTY